MGLFSTLNDVLGRNTWPPEPVRHLWEELELFAALRRSDRERLRLEAGYRWNDPYQVVPIPRLVARASANLLFGEPAAITEGEDADQVELDRLVEENGLDAELQRAALVSSSEGEVWGRVVVQPDLLDVPIVEFVSRRRVIPFFRGRFLIAATFVTEWPTSRTERMRLFETYEAGLVTSTLYRGTPTSLGQQLNLASFGPTATIPELVQTGIARPLVAFIPNSIDSDPTRGFSDYRGLDDRFLAINEASTVGQHNLVLAGRKRAFVDPRYLDQNGALSRADDVYALTQTQSQLGDSRDPIHLAEYTYEAGQVIAWVEHLLDLALICAGAAPQSVGRDVGGGAVSGTALRLKMAHSLVESSGKGRHFDRGLRWLLSVAKQLDVSAFGRSFTSTDPPAIERQTGLPRDDLEAAQYVATLMGAGAMSAREGVAEVHDDWADDQVDDELDEIRGDGTIEGPGGPPVSLPAG